MMSHGKLAEGLKDTLKLFIGEKHGITSISAYSEDVMPEKELQKILDSLNAEDQLVIMTDILGGSVNQLAIPHLMRENTFIVAGLNLPLAIAISCLGEDADIEDYRRIVEETQESIVLMNDYEFPNYAEDDE